MPTIDRTIAEQIVIRESEFAATPPVAILDAFLEEQAELGIAGVPDGVPAPGEQMPDGTLLDAHGNVTPLAQARRRRPAVVVFYRGAWCPYCNVALRAYQAQLLPDLTERGVVMIAISPQKPAGSLTMQETNALTYPVLSDPGNHIATQLGILNPPRGHAGRRSAQALGIDIAAANCDGTDALPMPTTVIVDAAGTIRGIDVHPDYSTRTESAEILWAVRSLMD
jgi:peroxiredoxin